MSSTSKRPFVRLKAAPAAVTRPCFEWGRNWKMLHSIYFMIGYLCDDHCALRVSEFECTTKRGDAHTKRNALAKRKSGSPVRRTFVCARCRHDDKKRYLYVYVWYIWLCAYVCRACNTDGKIRVHGRVVVCVFVQTVLNASISETGWKAIR